MITIDINGGVTFLNPVAQSLTGWTQEDAAGKPLDSVFKIINEESRRTVANPAFRALREGVVIGLANHTLLIAKDGKERPIDDSAAPIRNAQGEVAGVVLVFRDVTHRRRQVTQLTRLVDDLMEVSRITTGRVQLRHDRVVMNGIVERAVETARPLLDQRRHELTVSLSPEPIWLYADAARLEQVVVNLLTNSGKYTEEGGQIWLSVQQEGDDCVLRVRDTGVGIAPELLPRIFDLFTQAERSLDRSQGGLGIGLALVQRLVEMHRGRVEAYSALGQGSEFVVRLPIVLTPAPSPTAFEEETKPTGPSLRVLVVDDNPDAVESIALLLEESGHDVRTANDGAAAVEVALDYRPNVMLLDIGLPKMDGYEVAKEIRRQPALRDVVLIAMTGYGHESDRHLQRIAIGRSCARLVMKPPLDTDTWRQFACRKCKSLQLIHGILG